MSGLVPLWAAGIQELIWVVVVVLFVIIQIGGQILAKGREAQKRAARGGQPGGPNPPRKADALDDEIGEFLRRVAQRRAAGGPQQAGRGPAEPPPRSPTPKRPRARKPQAAEKPIRAEVVREPSVGDRTEELVKEDLNTAEFNRWPSDLGQEVGHTDARVANRRRRTGRPLGQHPEHPPGNPDQRNPPAARRPLGVRSGATRRQRFGPADSLSPHLPNPKEYH